MKFEVRTGEKVTKNLTLREMKELVLQKLLESVLEDCCDDDYTEACKVILEYKDEEAV